MKNKRKQVEPIPDEFANYEEAAEFWDTHLAHFAPVLPQELDDSLART